MKRVTFPLADGVSTVSHVNTREDKFYFLIWNRNCEINRYVLEKNSDNSWQFTNLKTGVTFSGSRDSFTRVIDSINEDTPGKRELYEFESLSELIRFIEKDKKASPDGC